jgi:hypothetical protein
MQMQFTFSPSSIHCSSLYWVKVGYLAHQPSAQASCRHTSGRIAADWAVTDFGVGETAHGPPACHEEGEQGGRSSPGVQVMVGYMQTLDLLDSDQPNYVSYP